MHGKYHFTRPLFGQRQKGKPGMSSRCRILRAPKLLNWDLPHFAPSAVAYLLQ